jgi:hypothetical protein
MTISAQKYYLRRVDIYNQLQSNFYFILDFTLENMTTRFSRLMAEYSSFQFKVKQRLSKLEKTNPESMES